MDKPPPDQSGGEWRLVPYIAPSGKSQVLRFLEDYRQSDFNGYAHLVEVVFPQLKATGPFTGPPHWEPLGGGLGEIRSRQCRIYCAVLSARRVMMLMGVIKRWRIFRNSDRRYCETCRTDAESSAYDQEKRGYLYKLHCQRRRANGS
jgi:hypothetical protein